MKSLRGLDLRMASSICSSSKQRALKPDSGWLLRQMAACRGRRSGFREKQYFFSSKLSLGVNLGGVFQIFFFGGGGTCEDEAGYNRYATPSSLACPVIINEPHFLFIFVCFKSPQGRGAEIIVQLPHPSLTHEPRAESLCPRPAPNTGTRDPGKVTLRT